MKKERIMVSISPLHMAKLREVSDITDVKIAELVRQAIEVWIYRHSQVMIDNFKKTKE